MLWTKFNCTYIIAKDLWNFIAFPCFSVCLPALSLICPLPSPCQDPFSKHDAEQRWRSDFHGVRPPAFLACFPAKLQISRAIHLEIPWTRSTGSFTSSKISHLRCCSSAPWGSLTPCRVSSWTTPAQILMTPSYWLVPLSKFRVVTVAGLQIKLFKVKTSCFFNNEVPGCLPKSMQLP